MIKKSVALEVESLVLAGQLYFPDEGNQASYPSVCICHGIPSHTPNSNDGGYPLLAERICHQGFVVLIFNFRGTGTSGGNIDLLGWTRDLKVAIDYLWALPEVDRSRLSLLGFSGGAAVSVYVASQDKRVSYVVTCACPAEFNFLIQGYEPQSIIDHFRSIGIIRDIDFPRSTEDWLNGFRLVSPIKYVAGIAPRPLLMLHGSQDALVVVSDAYRLYDKAGEPKELIIIDGAEHGLRRNDRAIDIVIEWLKSCAQIRYPNKCQALFH